jgi:hypothetical protein
MVGIRSGREGVSIGGMGLNLIGLLMLFRFGMPYKTRSSGAVLLAAEQVDEAEKRREGWYSMWGRFGLWIAVLGTLLQIWSTGVQGKLP